MSLNRNNNGFYLVDTEDESEYDITININSLYKNESKYSLWMNKNKERTLLKTDSKPAYIINLFSELLFSKFAENNNIKSAKIDGAIVDNRNVGVLSKDVVSEGATGFTLSDLLVFSIDAFSEFDTSLIDSGYITVDLVVGAIKTFAKKSGTKLDKDIRLSLLKMALVDYLTVQADRHAQNFMFEIQNAHNENVLKLCPMFDNEEIFSAGKFISEFEENPALLEEFLKNKTAYSKDLEFMFKTDIKDCLTNRQPALGITASVDPLSYAKSYLEIFTGIPIKKALEAFKADLVKELVNNSGLMEFYKSLKFDGDLYAKQIQDETGISLPHIFIESANEQFMLRKMSLDLALLKTAGTEPGEE